MTEFIKQQQELAREELRYVITGHKELRGYDLDTIISQIITNTGEELMQLAEEGRKKGLETVEHDYVTCYHCGSYEDCDCEGFNEAIDTLKKHITSVTGVE